MPAAGVEATARSRGMAAGSSGTSGTSRTSGVEVSGPRGGHERLRRTFTGVADEGDGGCLTGKVLAPPPSREVPGAPLPSHGEGGNRTPGARGGARVSGRGKVRYPRIVRGCSRGSRPPLGARSDPRIQPVEVMS